MGGRAPGPGRRATAGASAGLGSAASSPPAPVALRAGLGAGVAAAFALGKLTTTFPTAAKLEKASGMPVIGSIGEVVTAAQTAMRRRKLVLFAGGVAALCFAYVGLIGSATKRERFERWFRARGNDPRRTETLTCPIGAGLGRDKRPSVIAAMVAAELLIAFAKAKDVSATADPDSPANSIEDSTFTCARPPRK